MMMMMMMCTRQEEEEEEDVIGKQQTTFSFLFSVGGGRASVIFFGGVRGGGTMKIGIKCPWVSGAEQDARVHVPRGMRGFRARASRALYDDDGVTHPHHPTSPHTTTHAVLSATPRARLLLPISLSFGGFFF